MRTFLVLLFSEKPEEIQLSATEKENNLPRDKAELRAAPHHDNSWLQGARTPASELGRKQPAANIVASLNLTFSTEISWKQKEKKP